MRRRKAEDYTVVEPNYSYSWTLSAKGVNNTGRRSGFFSSTEILHVTVAIIALIVALTLVLWDFDYSSLPEVIVMASAAVLLGFFGHEMAHKVVARRYGCWAEFRANFRGLGLAIFISLFGILFAAPGAVYIMGNISQRENARISLAGPAVNLMIAGASAPFFMTDALVANGAISELAFYLYFFNAILALFNLVPVPPLDGSKIWRWNLPLYILVIGVAGLMFALAIAYLL